MVVSQRALVGCMVYVILQVDELMKLHRFTFFFGVCFWIFMIVGYAMSEGVRHLKQYPGTEWTTLIGDLDEIDAFCRRHTKNPPPNRIQGCLIPDYKVIAASSLPVCMHEAVHAADKEWDHLPPKIPLFDPEDE